MERDPPSNKVLLFVSVCYFYLLFGFVLSLLPHAQEQNVDDLLLHERVRDSWLPFC